MAQALKDYFRDLFAQSGSSNRLHLKSTEKPASQPTVPTALHFTELQVPLEYCRPTLDHDLGQGARFDKLESTNMKGGTVQQDASPGNVLGFDSL